MCFHSLVAVGGLSDDTNMPLGQHAREVGK